MKQILKFFFLIAIFLIVPIFASASNTLLSENFDNASFGSRGWYDAYPSSVISSGCYSGSCAQFSFSNGGTNPTQMPGGAMRHVFSVPTDRMYVSYWIKFNTGWRGSQQPYHPHLMLVSSNLDYAANQYTPLANNYLDTYLEFLSDMSSPYAVRPLIALQDEKNVNTSHGTVPNNLSSITEDRSVGYCNTPISAGATGGDCYADFTYYSSIRWSNPSTSVSIGSWHHVEHYFEMNSINGGIGQHDGIMQEWIDGINVMNYSNVLYRTGQHPTMKWQLFNIAPYIGDGAPVAESIVYDELNVADALPGGDTTAPASPSGLSVS